MVFGFHHHHQHNDGNNQNQQGQQYYNNQPPQVPNQYYNNGSQVQPQPSNTSYPQQPPPLPGQQHLGGAPYSNHTGPEYKYVLYFCNWAIYGRKHFPKDVPVDRVSHILYAFANVVPETGEVTLSDKWSDTDIALDGDSHQDPQSYLKGCLNQFYQLKKKHRHLKILLSIGGWTYSPNFAPATSTPERRRKFAASAVALLKDLGFDGLDIDWEYPADQTQAQQYVDLLRAVRLELDSYALETGLPRDQFELSIAAPAGPEQYQKYKIRDMDQYLTFWNLMTYDFAGSWSQSASYHSNLYQGEISTDKAICFYQNAGVSSKKIVMGMPIYGRAFANTDGIGSSFSGVGEGSWEAGTWDYKALPLSGAHEQTDMNLVGAFCYNQTTRTLVTYDNEETVKAKADYVGKKNLGGGMWWESSGDCACDSNRSLVGTFTNFLGVKNIDKKQNCLYYPKSSHENIRGTKPC